MRQQFRKAIHQNIGRIFGKAVAAKTVGYAAGPSARIARRLHIDFGITDHHALRGSRAEFAQNCFNAHGIRLLAFKAVAAVNKSKVTRQAQSLQDAAAGSHWLIGEHRHGHSGERVKGLRELRDTKRCCRACERNNT